jgi:hypothetical protein
MSHVILKGCEIFSLKNNKVKELYYCMCMYDIYTEDVTHFIILEERMRLKLGYNSVFNEQKSLHVPWIEP